MQYIFFFLLELMFLVGSVGAQNTTPTPTYKIIYKGYIELEHNITEQKSNKFEQTVLRSGQKTVAWHAWLPSYNNPASNDSVIYKPITDNDRKERFLPVYKNHDSSSVVFGYTSGLLKSKRTFASDTLHPFTWIVTNRTKMIDTLRCFKALTIFRGRSYSAWFAPSIPINEGPWKFGGLPGLIVEIYDEERNIYWKLTSFKQTDEALPPTPLPRLNYLGFRREYNEGYKRMAAAVKAEENIDPTCKTCSKQMDVKVKTIENLVD